MNEKEALRHECLLQLYGSGPVPISIAGVRKRARQSDTRASDSQIREALFFLVGQKLAEEIQDPATGTVLYRITSAGILHWERTEG